MFPVCEIVVAEVEFGGGVAGRGHGYDSGMKVGGG